MSNRLMNQVELRCTDQEQPVYPPLVPKSPHKIADKLSPLLATTRQGAGAQVNICIEYPPV